MGKHIKSCISAIILLDSVLLVNNVIRSVTSSRSNRLNDFLEPFYLYNWHCTLYSVQSDGNNKSVQRVSNRKLIHLTVTQSTYLLDPCNLRDNMAAPLLKQTISGKLSFPSLSLVIARLNEINR